MDKKSLNIVFAMIFTMFAGVVNVFGLLEIGNLFISFMSGNTARLSVAVAQGSFQEILPFLYIIVSFVLGAFLGNLAIEKSRKHQMIVSVLMSLAGLLFCLFFYLGGNMDLVMVALAMTMGMQNIAQIDVDGCVIGKTFVTGVLYQLGGTLAKVVVGKSRRLHALLYFASWIMILIGGGIGTFLLYSVGAEYTIITLLGFLCVMLLFLLYLEKLEKQKNNVNE